MARRNTAPRRFAALSLALAACTGPAPLVAPVDVQDQIAALEAETGHPWSIRLGPLGTPAVLEGQTAPHAVTPTDAQRAARSFIGAHRSLFVVSSNDMANVSAATLRDGTTHATLNGARNAISISALEHTLA